MAKSAATRNLEMYISMRQVVDDQFAQARIYHLSHAMIMNRINERVYSHPKYKRLYKYYRSRIGGYIEAQYARMYDVLEWRMYNKVTARYEAVVGPNAAPFEEFAHEGGKFFYKGTDKEYYG